MKALIQRVERADVSVGEKRVGTIDHGLLVLLGVTGDDTGADVHYLAKKTLGLRVFEDQHGLMNLNIGAVDGQVLVVSQFTLYADTRKGNRPGFTKAAPPHQAESLYDEYIEALKRTLGVEKVSTGCFGAMMKIELINDGPVTIEICSDDRKTSETHGAQR